jgi:hypothetical protein
MVVGISVAVAVCGVFRRLVVGAFVSVRVLAIVTAMRVAVAVFSDPEADEQNTRDQTDRAADPDSTQNSKRFVDLCETEIGFRVEERADHRDTADEVPDTEDETRRKAVEPLVRLIQRVRGGDGPSMPRFDPVDRPECDRAEQ